jgi:HSP20 family protein
MVNDEGGTSFLEKLTGSKRIEHNPTEEEIQTVTASKPEPIIEEELPEEIPQEPVTFEEPAPVAPSQAGSEGQLAVDVYQTEDSIIIKSTIAGVRPEDLDVSIANDMVTIKGTRRNEEKISEENWFYQECYWGIFSRTILLPVEVKAEEAQAKLKDGILKIILPKVDKAVAQKIKVISE